MSLLLQDQEVVVQDDDDLQDQQTKLEEEQVPSDEGLKEEGDVVPATNPSTNESEEDNHNLLDFQEDNLSAAVVVAVLVDHDVPDDDTHNNCQVYLQREEDTKHEEDVLSVVVLMVV